MTTVSELLVKVNADVQGLQRGLATSEASLKSFSASTAGAAKTSAQSASGISTAFNKLAPVFIAAGAAAVAGITKAVAATEQLGSQTRALQAVTGQTAESASQLIAIGAHLGIGADQLASSFALLQKNIGNNAAAFDKWGVATRDATGQALPFDTVLGNVADTYVGLTSASDKAAFASGILGRSYRALTPLLAQGADGIARMRGEAEKFGLVMSQQDVDATKALTLAQRDLGQAFKGLEVSLGRQFVPILTVAAHALTDVVEVMREIPGPVLATGFGFVALTGAIATVSRAGEFFSRTWGSVADLASVLADRSVELSQAASQSGSALLDQSSSALVAADATKDLAASAKGLTTAAVAQNSVTLASGQAAAAAVTPTEALTGATIELTGAVQGLATALGVELPAASAAGAKALAEVGGAEALAGAGEEVATGFSAAFPEIALVVAAVTAATLVIVKNWDTIKTAGVEAWNTIKTVTAPTITELRSAVEAIGKAALTAWDQIKAAAHTLASAFGDLGRALAPILTTFAQLAGAAVLGAIIGALKVAVFAAKALAAAVRIVADVVTAAMKVASVAVEAFAAVLRPIAPFLDRIAVGALAAWGAFKAGQAVISIVSGVVGILSSLGQRIIDAGLAAKSFATALLTTAKSAVAAVAGFAADTAALVALTAEEGIATVATLSLADAFDLAGAAILGPLAAAAAVGVGIGYLIDKYTGLGNVIGHLIYPDFDTSKSSIDAEVVALGKLQDQYQAGSLSADAYTQAVDDLNSANHTSLSDIPPLLKGTIAYQQAQQAAAGAASLLAKQVATAHGLFKTLADATGSTARAVGTTFKEGVDTATQSLLKLKPELSEGAAHAIAYGEQTKKAIDTATQAWDQYHDQTVGNIDFVGSALDQFANKAHVDLGAVSTALKGALADTHKFVSALLTIKNASPQGKEVAGALLALGPSYAGLTEGIAAANGKLRDKLIGQFADIYNAQQTGANRLTNALDFDLKKFTVTFKTLANTIAKAADQPLPFPKLDTSKTFQSVDKVRREIRSVADQKISLKTPVTDQFFAAFAKIKNSIDSVKNPQVILHGKDETTYIVDALEKRFPDLAKGVYVPIKGTDKATSVLTGIVHSNAWITAHHGLILPVTATDKATPVVSAATRRIINLIHSVPGYKIDADTSAATNKIQHLKDTLYKISQTKTVAHLEMVLNAELHHTGGLVGSQTNGSGGDGNGQINPFGGPRHTGGLIFHAGGVIDWSNRIAKLPQTPVKRMHSGALAADEVPAILQRGEFVVRRHAVANLGLPFMQAINRFHDGGGVGKLGPVGPTEGVSHLVEKFHQGGRVMVREAGKHVTDRLTSKFVEHFHGGGTVRSFSTTKIIERYHEGRLVGSHVADRAIQHLHEGGGTPRVGQGLRSAIATTALPSRVQMAQPSIPRMVERIHHGGMVERFHTLQRMHDGGPVLAQPAPPMANRAPSLDPADLERAFRNALHQEREKIYLDRKRFGDHLGNADAVSGHW